MDDLVSKLRNLHLTHSGLQEFVDFPPELQKGNFQRQTHPVEGLLANENWPVGPYDRLLTDLNTAAGKAQWRRTYADTTIDQDFKDRFGCFCLIGDGGFWSSSEISAYLVYMPAGLHYPWHQHPAEEIYVVLAGHAEFAKGDDAPKLVGTGQSVFHPSSTPHATTTHNQALLAYVVWRNHLDVRPIWSDPELYD